VKAYDELCAGYKIDPASVFKVFDSEKYDGIVILKNVEFHSLCEHHVLPFSGKAHIAYIPNEKVIGVSKLARLLEIYTRRLQIQERIGEQVVNDIMKYLSPKGAACILEAQHMCMTCRGVNKQDSVMITSSLRGCFLAKDSARQELMSLIK
jgi:GTP cyclohydrolase I